MIHKFKIKGTNILVDVNSGAIHVVSDIVYDILDLFEDKPSAGDKQAVVDKLSGQYDPAAVAEGFEEIMQICEQNLLFSEDPYGEIAKNFVKEPLVKALCLHVSHDCNLRCGYCFAGTGNFSGERCTMSAEVGKKAIDFVIQNSGSRKNIEIDFFGGEPLMNFDVVKELTEYAKAQGEQYGKVFRFTVTTNGVLLDDKKMEFINENMGNLVLSIDGRKDVNDRMRKTVSGEGSYELIMPKFRKAADSRNQQDYYVRGTFTRHNLDFAEDVLHLADNGFKQISVEPVVGGKDTDYALREEDLPVIFEQYEYLAEQYIKRWNTDGWFNFFHFMIDLDQGPCVIKRMSGCGAGCEYVAVTPDGDIYPCHQFVGNEDFKLGNVLDGVYKQDLTADFSGANVYTKDKCKNCWAKFYCSGGCHANAYQFSGSISEPYEIGCELERKRVECALYIKAHLNS